VQNDYPTEDAFEADGLTPLHSASITYRIALGPQQGRKVFTLQTLPASEDDLPSTVGKGAGFSLHAGLAERAHEREKAERLCRFVSQPPVAECRLSLTPNGEIRYRLKTPYREGLPHERSECFGYGTTHVIFQPLELMAHIPVRHPGGAQIGCPADLSWRAWRLWCHARSAYDLGAAVAVCIADRRGDLSKVWRCREDPRLYGRGRGDREDPGVRRCKGSATGSCRAPTVSRTAAAQDQ
jgi:hypothetical protein